MTTRTGILTMVTLLDAAVTYIASELFNSCMAITIVFVCYINQFLHSMIQNRNSA